MLHELFITHCSNGTLIMNLFTIMDQDSAFQSSVMNYLLKTFDIKINTVALYNHQTLLAEHGIKSLSTILTKHLTGLGQMYLKYLPLATLAYIMYLEVPTWNIKVCTNYVLIENRFMGSMLV